MKKITRTGVILLVIGISLLLMSAFRASSPHMSLTRVNIPSTVEWSILNPRLWSPRNLRLEVSSGSEVDIYILDEQGIKLWEEEKTLSPLFTFNEVKQDMYEVQLNRRGKYTLLIHNLSSSDMKIHLSLTLYGFENDLLLASVALIMLGAIMIVIGKMGSRQELKFSRATNP